MQMDEEDWPNVAYINRSSHCKVSVMANWKWFGKVHIALYKASNGRLGARLGGMDIALIDTIGRKTGQIRQVVLACYPYKEGVVVVGSNNGQENDPVWWLNLKAVPEVKVCVGKNCFTAIAEELNGEEREVFWPVITKINPRQKQYAKMTSRVLPVVYLKRKLP
jgi:F420H(2)-dependent quinone reductase